MSDTPHALVAPPAEGRRRGVGKGAPDVPGVKHVIKNVLEVSLLLLQVHSGGGGGERELKRVQPSVVHIVTAIRLFLICLNFFICL